MAATAPCGYGPGPTHALSAEIEMKVMRGAGAYGSAGAAAAADSVVVAPSLPFDLSRYTDVRVQIVRDNNIPCRISRPRSDSDDELYLPKPPVLRRVNSRPETGLDHSLLPTGRKNAGRKLVVLFPRPQYKVFQYTGVLQIDREHFRSHFTQTDNASLLHAMIGQPDADREYIAKDTGYLVAKKIREKRADPKVQRALFETLDGYFKHFTTRGNTLYVRNGEIIFGNITVPLAGSDKYEHDTKLGTSNSPVEKHFDRCVEAYLNACHHVDYSFTSLDLPVVALVLEKRVEVYNPFQNAPTKKYGDERHERIVLMDSLPQTNRSHVHFQRCTEIGFQERVGGFFRSTFSRDLLTVPAAQEINEFFNAIESNFPVQGISPIVLGYAIDSQIISRINVATKEVFDKETWGLTLSSLMNWKFVQQFQRYSTQIVTPVLNFLKDRDILNSQVLVVEAIVCRQFYPGLMDIHFRLKFDLSVIEDVAEHVIQVLRQNPNCRALTFTMMRGELLEKIVNALPHLRRQLESLTLDYFRGDSSVLRKFQGLRRLSISNSRLNSFQVKQVLEACPLLRDLFLSSYYGSQIEVLKARSKGLYFLDVGKADGNSLPSANLEFALAPGCFRFRDNCEVNSQELFRYLLTIDTLQGLDISHFNNISEEQVNVTFCFFRRLEYLNLIGIKISLETLYFLMSSLSQLRHIKIGGFVAARKSSTVESKCGKRRSKEETDKFSVAANKAADSLSQLTGRPKVEVYVEPLLVEVSYDKSAESMSITS